MSISEFLDVLSGVRQTASGYEAKCPAHDDHKPSLGVSEGAGGRILLCCRAGCSPAAVVTALGLKMSDLFADKSKPAIKPSIEATYDYTDEHGMLQFQCVRYVPKDFRQRRPDPTKPGTWIWNLNGVRKVIYRLPEVLAAIASRRTVFVAEGEKDCDDLAKAGFVATCNPMGASKSQDDNKSKWLPEHTEYLRGAARVVVIADKDEAGRAHAAVVAKRARAVAASVRLIELRDRDDKTVKDAADWFGADGTADELRALVEAASEFVPEQTLVRLPSSYRPAVDAANHELRSRIGKAESGEAGSSPGGPTGNPHEQSGQSGRAATTPARWFAERFPAVSEDEFGRAILEEADKHGILSAKDIGEDYLAATLGAAGRPDAPTVFLPAEEKFFTYSPGDGIFTHQREPGLLARLSRLLLDCARDCRDSCETQTLEFRFRDSASLSGVLRKARGLLEKPHDFFSTDLAEFLPCGNGMLRLRDKTLLPFSPDYRRRNKLAVSFDAAAKCPLFLDTLMRAALDPDELDLLQRWCGMALIGENLAQRILILTGTAGGGKGTFIRVLTGIIGQTNLASLRPQLLGERFELGRFLGRTLLYGADVPANFLDQRGASFLKSLTGYDPVTLEFKNSNESPAIICRFNVVVTCNSRLTVHLEGDTDAWRRRLAIIEYNKPKPEHVIADLDRRILNEEAPGVLNWMLEGLDKLRADGWQLHLSGTQQAAVDNLLLESDSHALFVREEMARTEGGQLTVTECFSAYAEFCNRRGWAALTRNKFGQAAGDVVARVLGLTIRHDIPDANGKAQRGWQGLALREKNPGPTDKRSSEVSGTQSPDEPDDLSPVQPEKNPDSEALNL